MCCSHSDLTLFNVQWASCWIPARPPGGRLCLTLLRVRLDAADEHVRLKALEAIASPFVFPAPGVQPKRWSRQTGWQAP